VLGELAQAAAPRARRRSGSLDSEARPSSTHVVFRAADRKAVDRFHGAGLDAGGRDNGKPGLHTDYAPTYYAGSCSIPTATTSRPSA